THDIDAPFLYRSWKGLLRSLLDKRGFIRSLRGKFGDREADPYYTFPRIFAENRRLLEKGTARSIFFLKGGGSRPADKPHYDLRSKDMRRLIRTIREQGGGIGLHASYEAGIKPSLIEKEKARIEQHTGLRVSYNRHHFLSSREPEDMDYLVAAGLTDDFTLGYADVAGFRLGTSYPVCWMNPLTRSLTPLRLHPLAVMDVTLEEKKYMGLTYEEASAYCFRLAEQTGRLGGELNLLWHNTSLQADSGSYLHKLYTWLLDQLIAN
ncbi:MAG: polysaccharide deacetylase family protein, partial [Tannerellaceae bacterium]|nr:polysaccharide deacetylase family protein [Tannerellaceae bacterium]